MQQFKITDKIKNLEINDKIKKNLLFYNYDNALMRTLHKKDINKDDVKYISTFSSFKGEIYENIIYELLMDFAYDNDEIVNFILKGPYQDKENVYIKSGLMIDRSSQIVYKSAYKDISEFDALFFTKESVYFVEMSTSKKTASLNKRLAKKHALLKMIFPSLEIKCLVVVTKGSVGLKNFPDYTTVWVTEEFNDDNLIDEIIHLKKRKKNQVYLEPKKHKKFNEACTVRYKKFQYFPTLEWILNKSRANPKFIVDLRFFSSKKLELYFDIYTKLYIGYILKDDFMKLWNDFPYEVKNDRIIVTIEKVNQTELDLVYYVKENNGKLKRVRLGDEVSIKEKELDGFTNAEVRFFMNVLEEKHKLYANNINFIKDKIYLIR